MAMVDQRRRKVRARESWAGTSSELARHVVDQSARCLDAYAVNPLLVKQDANIERATAQGGYGRRQIYELVQNGADALIGFSSHASGRIEVVLTDESLYCANEGSSIDLDGVNAILTSHISMKRGTEIGRFGLGFKSVLGVSDQPSFFSRSGSFGFRAAESEARIRSVVPDAERVPTLRVADPLLPEEEAGRDAVLAELMEWATTVVRLPRTVEDTSWLSDDIRNFPPEFLLFSAHVGLLGLEDRTLGERREIRLRRSGSKYRLEEDNKLSEWQVFTTLHRPSDSARKDAGELADRESIPLIWAVPTKGRLTRGKFWAFFPTEYLTTLSGILNAPWKTNEDRQNLLPGPFNDELLEVAADLIVDGIPELITKRDPGKFLENMPARGREAANWADESLGEKVYQRAIQKPSLPDQRGDAVLPRTLSMHPPGLERAWLDEWAEYPGRPIDWVHPSVESKDRRPRAERLIGTDRARHASLQDWLEALVDDGTAASSVFALRLAARIAKEAPALLDDLRRARIVLTEDADHVASTEGTVFLRAKHDHVDSSLTFVHKGVANASEVKEALTALGVGRVDATGEFEAFLNRGLQQGRLSDWAEFWGISRRVGAEQAAAVVSRRVPEPLVRINARNANGEYRPLVSLLMPGIVVPADGSRDAAATIDTTFHADDLELLGLLGMVDAPRAGRGETSESWYSRYAQDVRERYYAALPPRSSRPDPDYLVLSGPPMPGPLVPLENLSVEGAALFTERVLSGIDHDPVATWRIRHRTERKYPEMEFEAPWLWLLRRFGALQTSLGPRRVADCLAPSAEGLDAFFPVAACDDHTASLLALAKDVGPERSDFWVSAFARIGQNPNDSHLGQFYAFAASRVPQPTDLVCRVGFGFASRAPGEITVVTSRKEVEALVRDDTPTLLAPNVALAHELVNLWGLQPAAKSVRTEVRAVPSADPAFLVDEFPPLARILVGSDAELILARCEEIEVQTVTASGRTAESRPWLRDGDTFYWAGGGDDRALLLAVSDELGLGLSSDETAGLLEQRTAQRQRDRLVSIRAQNVDGARLLAAIGPDRLRRRLPLGLVEAVQARQGDVSDLDLAQMALAVYGVGTLKEFREELDDAGLQPPHSWAGSRAARNFARDLGFPPEFAGFERARRDPVMEVEGPAILQPLHDFQEQIAANMREVLTRKSETRGLLSLPTGAGKTRVAVQAVIDEVSAGALSGPILWIAQSDELCEQAVGTWAYVWRAAGPQTRLSISRLWESRDAVPAEEGTFQVVVATIDKLRNCAGREEYDWLSLCAAVVIDEAHGSTTTEYTKVLDWLGLGRGKERCPLVGLTATPFRGTSESETKALINRYGQRRLDEGVLPEDPYVQLQRDRILATVEHRLLDGTQIELDDEELDLLQRLHRLPKSVEERLGRDLDRSRVLIESIKGLPDTWPVLLFAPSVANAQVLAAMLTLEGIQAAAISGSTEPGARRHYIEEFRQGRTRVLTNYNVLTQGFDAPKVRAVYVARPTFSPNLYQQMIGRGLRGHHNGGEDVCLIVNVADNVRQYGHQLAFRDFEYLWQASR